MDPACFVASPRTPDEHKPVGVGYYASLAARTWINSQPALSTAPLPPTVEGIPCDPIGVVSTDRRQPDTFYLLFLCVHMIMLLY